MLQKAFQDFERSPTQRAAVVNEVVSAGQQVPLALSMAREMAEFSRLVLKTLKRFVTDGVLAQGPSEQSGRASAHSTRSRKAKMPVRPGRR